VAYIEGKNFPFFGLAFSPEKVLYNYDYDKEDIIGFEKDSITHS